MRVLTTILIVLLCCCGPPGMGQSNEGQSIRMGVFQRTYDLFPELDGKVWGFSVVNDVFAAAGYEVITLNLPIKRIQISLKQNQIDVAWMSKEGMIAVTEEFLSSDYPVARVPFMIYYDHRKAWKPSWPPEDEFINKVGISTQSSRSLNQQFNLNINQTKSFDANLKMVNMGRADYCIDHTGGFGTATPGLQKSQDEGFAFETLYYRGIYVWFKDTKRGQELLQVFNQGLLNLLKEGGLGKSYCKDIPCPVEQEQITSVADMVNEAHPDWNIPPQPLK